MAFVQNRPPNINFDNANKASYPYGNDSTQSSSLLTSATNYNSINTMRTYLAGANASYYTAARLDSLTVNDMIFAVRNMQDAKSIADYMNNSAA